MALDSQLHFRALKIFEDSAHFQLILDFITGLLTNNIIIGFTTCLYHHQ